jgi:hypothetical protein
MTWGHSTPPAQGRRWNSARPVPTTSGEQRASALRRAPSGEAFLETRAPTGRTEVALVVSNTGPGLSAGALLRIFDPFFTTKPIGPSPCCVSDGGRQRQLRGGTKCPPKLPMVSVSSRLSRVPPVS